MTKEHEEYMEMLKSIDPEELCGGDFPEDFGVSTLSVKHLIDYRNYLTKQIEEANNEPNQ